MVEFLNSKDEQLSLCALYMLIASDLLLVGRANIKKCGKFCCRALPPEKTCSGWLYSLESLHAENLASRGNRKALSFKCEFLDWERTEIFDKDNSSR